MLVSKVEQDQRDLAASFCSHESARDSWCWWYLLL